MAAVDFARGEVMSRRATRHRAIADRTQTALRAPDRRRCRIRLFGILTGSRSPLSVWEILPRKDRLCGSTGRVWERWSDRGAWLDAIARRDSSVIRAFDVFAASRLPSRHYAEAGEASPWWPCGLHRAIMLFSRWGRRLLRRGARLFCDLNVSFDRFNGRSSTPSRERVYSVENSKSHPSQFLASLDRNHRVPMNRGGRSDDLGRAQSEIASPTTSKELKREGLQFCSASENRVFQQNRHKLPLTPGKAAVAA